MYFPIGAILSFPEYEADMTDSAEVPIEQLARWAQILDLLIAQLVDESRIEEGGFFRRFRNEIWAYLPKEEE